MISINNLDFHYPQQNKLLENLQLQLQVGKIHGLLGKNGEGKSTLLKLISGLVFPTAGEISVLGYKPQQRSPELLKEIYFLPEEFPEFPISIGTFEKIYAPFYPNFNAVQFNSYLNEFEINSKKSDLNKLSQGQKKKVMIAFGLATNTKLLLMDEPTNGLDIPSKGQFRRMVAAAAQNDKCIIISTHQVRDLEKLIDSIIIMEQHQILFNQTTESICKKLIFKESEIIPEHKYPIFAEKSLRGVAQIYENIDNEESNIDIELLFNALLSERSKICQLFEN